MSKSLLIVGAGSRGLTVYSAYANEHPEQYRVVGVAEPRDWQREETARRHGLPPSQVFSDWREAAARPRLADAVIIATQDHDHVEPALAFMASGYDVLLEKPMDTTPQGCRQLVEAARRQGVLLVVAHVLRYTPYFRLMKRVVDSGALGQIVTLRHMEPVHYWHQAHSFVRGNWRREDTSAPMILSKSCHDMDLFVYLLGRPCSRLSSFGRLSHFRAENRPAQATDRCLDCPLADSQCPYSATRFYLDKVREGYSGWPVDVLTSDPTPEGVTRALRDGPYGRCVYACDNDVVDHQVVSMEFSPDITATFTMTAFTEHRWRETEVLGSHGQLVGDGQFLRLTRFCVANRLLPEGGTEGAKAGEWVWNTQDPNLLKGHGGGDEGLMDEFYRALCDRSRALENPLLDARQSLQSHLMAFAAERARLEGRVVEVEPQGHNVD